MPFGQAIIGPPGSGKTTFCLATTTLMRSTGRTVCVVNLDPANDELPYECDVDVAALVSLEAVQESTGLGPNGGLAYCMDYLLENFDWLEEQLEPHTGAGKYVVFDCPGQSELYMCHDAFQRIVGALTRRLHFNLTAVQLVDAHLCCSPHKYLAALLTTLTSMLHLELPHVNVLSKADLLERLSGSEVVDAEQLADVDTLRHDLEGEPSGFATRFAGLTTGLCDVLENYGLVSLVPVAVEQPETLAAALDLIDRANGFNLSGLQGHNPYPEARVEGSSRLQDYLSAGPRDIWGDTHANKSTDGPLN